MPRQGTAQEVEQHVSQGLDVIPPALLDAQVGVDAGVPGCARQVLVLAVGDVYVGLGVSELLSQAKVDDVHLKGSTPLISLSQAKFLTFDTPSTMPLTTGVLTERHCFCMHRPMEVLMLILQEVV